MASEFIAKRTYHTDHSSPLRFILSHIRRRWYFTISLMIGAFSNAALAGAVPAYIGKAFDEITRFTNGLITGEEALAFAGQMALLIIISQSVRAVLQLMRNASSEAYGQMIERDVRDELYASLLGKSMTFHDLQPVGEIMARVTNDVREMNLMMNPGINLLIGSWWFLIVPVLGAPLIHPALLWIPLIFVIAQVFVQWYFLRQLRPIAEEVRGNFGKMNSRLAEALDGMQVIKGAAQEEQEVGYFRTLADRVRDQFVKQGRVEARYLANLMLPLTMVLALVQCISLYQAGEILIGDIVAYSGLIGLFGFPVFSSLNSLSRIALGVASAERILSIINAETDLDQNDQGYDQPMKGEIRFEQVNFGYTPDKEALHDITFAVQPGQTVAIVGQTGSGKTTITKLINRIYDATSGRVLVDGVDVRDWKLGALRRQISIIEQDIFLFSRTIAENIAFGKPDASRDEIIEAAKKAQAHEFIESFKEGYDTVVGQRGVTLSGGQRQRIAIARAFLTNPPILILDDSTSAIDSATEDKIQRAIYAASKGRTMILITHRLSQIRWADHIVVLRKGRIVAQGKHEDLLHQSEAYRRIFARYETTEEMRAVVAGETAADHGVE
jgi:ATP-binding cassette, subfamily B, bacterial